MTELAETLTEVVHASAIEDRKEVKASTVYTWWCAEWRKILSEFISTMMLLLLGCMTVIPLEGPLSPVMSALGFGMVIVVLVQIFGHVSGALMNPVVTLASMILGYTSIPLGIVYIVVQCLGAITGYGLLDVLTSMDLAKDAVCVGLPYRGQTKLQTFGIEAIITAALILVTSSMWDPIHAGRVETVPLRFGLTIVALLLVSGSLTGAGMNPARSLGPAVWTNIWTDHWIYWIAPICGSVLASFLYKHVFLSTNTTD